MTPKRASRSGFISFPFSLAFDSHFDNWPTRREGEGNKAARVAYLRIVSKFWIQRLTTQNLRLADWPGRFAQYVNDKGIKR